MFLAASVTSGHLFFSFVADIPVSVGLLKRTLIQFLQNFDYAIIGEVYYTFCSHLVIILYYKHKYIDTRLVVRIEDERILMACKYIITNKPLWKCTDSASKNKTIESMFIFIVLRTCSSHINSTTEVS